MKRTVILLGSTGGGKSALGNAILGRIQFPEDDGSTGVTREHQIAEMNDQTLHVKLIDTVGLGDASLTEQEVLYRLAAACHAARDGLSQVFFVTGGRLSNTELQVYDIMRTVIFTNDITRFVTIVRTRFSKFMDAEECNQDITKIRNTPGPLAEMLASCNSLIHVNNPPEGPDVPNARAIRAQSCKRLLTFLHGCDQVYKPRQLDEVTASIQTYMEEKGRLERENEEIKQMLQTLGTQMQQQEQEALRKMAEMHKDQQRMLQQHAADKADMERQQSDMQTQFSTERQQLQQDVARKLQKAEQQRKEEMQRQQLEMTALHNAEKQRIELQAAAQQAEAERLRDREAMLNAQIERERQQAAAQMQQILASRPSGGSGGGGCVIL